MRQIALAIAGVSLALPLQAQNPAPDPSYRALSQTLLERAEAEVENVRKLVEGGTLPKARLAEAETRLADARDEMVLTDTLYGPLRTQDMTPEQASAMVAAAQRRVDRQQILADSRRKLLDMGILARADLNETESELASRARTLQLAESRANLLDELKRMAETERRLEKAAQEAGAAASLRGVMLRYDGNGAFDLRELASIGMQFEHKFHRQLPVSAIGETALHRSMGLDHRNRADVALNPDSTEGLWLRHLLEKLRVPYLAFRSAVAGAATAPHIHIGPGSTRLVLALR